LAQPPRRIGRHKVGGSVLDERRSDQAETPEAVSVVIPTFNRRRSLGRVIESVLRDPATAEVVVVVDGSSDGSIELLEQLSRSEPRVKPLSLEHRGLNAAVQAGVEQATSEIVLILDDDLEASPGLVSAHARHHEAASNLVVLGYSPVVTEAAGSTTAVTASLYGEAYERSCRSFEDRPEDILLHLYGGHMSIRRSACLSTGVYSEDFPERYHPDREFGIRCLKAGLVGRFDRSLLARHYYSRSLSEFRSDARSQGAATVVLHRLHRDVLGPIDPDISMSGAPTAARWVIRLSRHRSLHAVATAVVASSVRLLGRLRALSLQRSVAKLLTRMEHQRGLYEALAQDGDSAPQ
jgi:glycosyltransferase involved in cell wall biosynthesis